MSGSDNMIPQNNNANEQAVRAPTQDQGGNLLYDLSSFDPLQAHALQLTASAGLTNVFTSAPGSSTNQSYNLPNANHATTSQSNSQPAYYYAPQGNPSPPNLQPIAPANHSAASQAAPSGYILPSLAPASMQNPYAQQILPQSHAGAHAAQVAPGLPNNLLLAQQLQNVVAPQPAPLAPAIATSHKRDISSITQTESTGSKKQKEIAPSVVSSSTNSFSMNNTNQLDKPPQEASQADLDRMTPAERRRYERNLREQQRSYKISQQIKELRDVLSESNVPFKPNKYSILLSVVDYIKQLQSRAIMLDAEHQKLITTIRQTNDMVNSGTTPSSGDEAAANASSDGGSDNEMLFVQGLDYHSVFTQCPAALAIASLDGRIMECNPEFESLIALTRGELMKQSLFNLVRNHQDIFRAMADMLKVAEVPGDSAAIELKNRFWSGEVLSNQDTKLSVNLTLTIAENGTPKFFNCALTTSDSY